MATSFPTASSLGILANGTDQTTALNTALSNANYAGIIFDYSPPAAVTISGAVTATGKVLQFFRGNTLTGAGSVTGGFIDADYNSKIWDTSLLIKPQGTVNKYYSLKWSGATGNGTTNDWAALQNDINICTYNGIRELYLPAGTYMITKGLLFRQDVNGQYQGLTPGSISTSNFLSGICLTGDGIPYDGTPGQTVVNCTDGNSFAIGLQRVKGFRCKGIAFTGINAAPGNYNLYQVLEDPTSTFLSPGSRSDSLSPHCGVNIDPFSSSATPSGHQYPDYTGYYTETSNGGSTDVEFEDCIFRFFTVGRAVSINGFSQNGEIIVFRNCWADFNKSSLATGQSQSRSVFCYDDHIWGGTMIIYDGSNYGGGTAAPVTSIGLNTAGGNRFLCTLNGWASNGMFLKNAHIELLWSLGGSFFGAAGQLTIEDSWVALAGPQPSSGVTQPYTVFNGAWLKITNSKVSQYGAAASLPLSICCGRSMYENVIFDLLPINFGGYVSYKDCFQISSFGDSSIIGFLQVANFGNTPVLFTTGMKIVLVGPDPASTLNINRERKKLTSNYLNVGLRDIVAVGLSTTITLTSVSYTTNTAQFSLSTSSVDYKNLLVGDIFIFPVTDEFGNVNILAAFGLVTSLSGGTVTLSGIAKNLNTTTAYSVYLDRHEYLILPLLLGNVTSGSNIVSSVVVEGGGPVTAGTPVYIPHFPLGTTIVSYNSGTAQLTLSNNATITETNVAILSSDWIGEEVGGAPYTTNAYALGYKKGDRIYNNRTDLYPNIRYWQCTKSGVTGTARIPEFVSYDAKESVSYTAASVTGATADINKVSIPEGHIQFHHL